MRSQLISPPTIEPVTLQEAKLYCKVSHSIEDDLIRMMISSARETAESYARISIAPQQYRVECRTPRIVGYGMDLMYPMDSGFTGDPEFGSASRDLDNTISTDRINDPDTIWGGMQFPKGPVQSVDAVYAFAINGTRTLVDPALYTFFAGNLLWTERRWLLAKDVRGVQFEITTGYPVQPVAEGSTAEPKVELPADIREAILIMIADRYEHRGQSGVLIPPLAKQILGRHWTSNTYRS